MNVHKASLKIAPKWEQPKCPSVDKFILKM